jgi:hypothetical protein
VYWYLKNLRNETISRNNLDEILWKKTQQNVAKFRVIKITFVVISYFMKKKFLFRDHPNFFSLVWTVGEVDFLIILFSNFLQFAIDWKNNSKAKVEKVFFFIFMSAYAEMSFLK